MASIEFCDVTKAFSDGTVAVDSLNLEVADGEFLVLVGPSGSGKTTALRMTAGLEEISSGDILIGDKVVNDLAPKQRDIAMVFQNYALYPHMTVAGNMGFGLKLRGVAKTAIRERVGQAADMLGVGELLHRKPGQLSGGQRQRVAMGRAIVREPQAFLMDEPLSNLDAKLRVEMRAYISLLHQQLGTTTLYVTHDQTEAMTMGDRVAVMRNGLLEQCASPQTLYREPQNLFVASFIGSPAMNLVLVTLEREEGELFVQLGDARLPVRRPALAERVGQEIVLGIRPEDFEDASLAQAADATMDVTLALAEPLGAEVIAHFRVDAKSAAGRRTVAEAHEGTDGVLDSTGDGVRITARLSARSTAETGGQIRLALDAARLHFFDPVTEQAIG
ncbi:MAG: multiple sugar transport system ATP-binding protein [Gaiellaceae bacterium]|jgi:multiple sugar transport system ATP-binding protein|nr:multiple sugar transport system ATP-binding protein [Gaiellaceae bacterium]